MTFIRTFIARFRGSEFAKNAAILTIGTMAAQGIAIVSMPVLSRLYTPADFGLLAVFLAVSGIVATAITLRFDSAILLPKIQHESKALVLLSGSSSVLIGILVLLIAWLIPNSVKSALGILVLNEWLLLAVLFGISVALTTTASTWYNRQRAYLKISALRVTQGSTSVLLAIVLGFWGFHNGLMLAQLSASLIVVVMLIFGLHRLRVNWRGYDFLAVAKKYRASPQYLLPTSLLDVVSLQLPVLLITAWFGDESAGQFSMAWKVSAIPSALIGAAVGQVFLQKFSETWPDVQAGRKLLFQTWKILALVGLLPTVLIIFFGGQLFSLILGGVWRDAGNMAAILAPMLYAMFISSPTSGTFLVLGMQRYNLLFGIAVLIYRPICIWIGVLNDDLIFGLTLLAAIEVVQILIYQAVVVKRMSRL
jgi:O-antigen/teichoic acid export membrane protein